MATGKSQSVFPLLTREVAGNLSQRELLLRLDREQQYWIAKVGNMTDDEADAYQAFRAIHMEFQAPATRQLARQYALREGLGAATSELVDPDRLATKFAPAIGDHMRRATRRGPQYGRDAQHAMANGLTEALALVMDVSPVMLEETLNTVKNRDWWREEDGEAERLAAILRALPLPLGTRVRHYIQQWTGATLHGTGAVAAIAGYEGDGPCEYLIYHDEELATRDSPGETAKPSWWSSSNTIAVERDPRS